ncbi:RidA family protein [Limnochorda pilosa]|uniref:LysR family transcriptional regulator n=1 Tax=Limnochorda pilosa TaxID=1555112 RepID=A0A0K2SM08_LIMPI|nr:RidA family protein [Limnochorda pilosa]BAS28052.1 LysR family transcriptional regulator [Limnochorda pilosa]
MAVEARLQEMGLRLPEAPAPMAAYVPAVRAGNLVFISGQGPIRDGQPAYRGKVGSDLKEEDGREAARLAILNALAVLKAEVGDLERVRRIVKLLGWVNSAPGFERQPFVINGASELLEHLFGERGRHARSAVAANELPFGIPVEIEMIAEVEA